MEGEEEVDEVEEGEWLLVVVVAVGVEGEFEGGMSVGVVERGRVGVVDLVGVVVWLFGEEDGCFLDEGEGEEADEVVDVPPPPPPPPVPAEDPLLHDPSSRPTGEAPAGEVEEEGIAALVELEDGEVEEAGDLDLPFPPPPRTAVGFLPEGLDVEVEASGWRGDVEEEEEAIRQRKEKGKMGDGWMGREVEVGS